MPHSIRRLSPRIVLLALVLAVLVGVSPSTAQEGAPVVEFIEPVAQLYTQIVAVSSGGIRTLHVSGQVGGGETLEEQSKAAFSSLEHRLKAAGATPDDVVKLTTYVVTAAGGQAVRTPRSGVSGGRHVGQTVR